MLTASAFAGALPRPARAALFLDFDGTLVDLAPTPDGIVVPPGLPHLLEVLSDRTGGALALVSGRSVEALSGFLPGFDGPMVGGHGAQLRLDGQVTQHAFAQSDALRRITEAAQRFAAQHDGLLAEPKPTGVVLHYRGAPAREAEVLAFAGALAEATAGIELHDAKMAAELRPEDVGKDRAVAHLLGKAPFHGRVAVFCGDDATDEPAMRLAVALGGTACKIGHGDSVAPLRVARPADLLAALQLWSEGETSHDRTPDRRIEPDPDRG